MDHNNTTHSNITGETHYYDDDFYDFYDGIEFRTLIKVYRVAATTISVLGAPINLWMLAAILTSRDLRVFLRNQWICGILICNVLELCCFMPIATYSLHYNFNCAQETLFSFVCPIEEFVNNWTIVCLLLLFSLKADRVTLQSRFERALRCILVVMPWLAALVITSILFFAMAENRMIWSNHTKCLTVLYKPAFPLVARVIAFLVPIVAALIVLSKILWTKNHSHEIGSGRGVTSISEELWPAVRPYVAILVAVVVLDVPLNGLQIHSSLYWISSPNVIIIHYIVLLISWLRSLVMPLVFTLMPGLRDRVLSWRPWRREPRTDEMTVSFTNPMRQHDGHFL